MNRTQRWVASAAVLAFVAQVSAESAATSSLPPEIAASLNVICGKRDDGRPDPAWVRQSFENDRCSLPPEPPVLDGTKASRAQLMTGLVEAKRFASSADRYQKCISADLAQRRQEAQRTGKPILSTFVTTETYRIAAGEASKKRVRDQIAMAVDDFNAEGSECPD